MGKMTYRTPLIIRPTGAARRLNQEAGMATGMCQRDLAMRIRRHTRCQSFVRISLMGVGNKQPLMLTPLPTSAPLSPFTTDFPPPFVSAGPNVTNP